MRLACLLAVSAAALGLMGFQDSKNQFTVDFPEGWTVGAPNADGSVLATAPGNEALKCTAQSNPIPGLANVTQDQINTAMIAPFETATWADMLSLDAAKLTAEGTTANIIDGRLFQKGTVTLKADAAPSGKDVKILIGVWILTGRLVSASCMTHATDYDAAKDMFEKTVSSIRPL